MNVWYGRYQYAYVRMDLCMYVCSIHLEVNNAWLIVCQLMSEFGCVKCWYSEIRNANIYKMRPFCGLRNFFRLKIDFNSSPLSPSPTAENSTEQNSLLYHALSTLR